MVIFKLFKFKLLKRGVKGMVTTYLSFETRILGCIFICVSVCKDFSAVSFGHQCFKYVMLPRLTKLTSMLLCNV